MIFHQFRCDGVPSAGSLLRSVLLVCMTLVVACAGCASRGGSSPAPAAKQLAARVPALTTQKETKESQTKSGLTIALAPGNYDVKAHDHVRYEQYDAGFGERMMGSGNEANYVYVHQITESVAAPEPNRLKFVVTVNNQMPRVFHGGGTVVQFKVGGRLLAVEQGGYAELQNAVVPPRTEQQITIYGPALDQVPDSGTLGVFFYDVVTNQNEAGVVTEKQNYEWYFDYTVEQRIVAGHPDRVQSFRVTPEQLEQMQRAEEGREKAEQMQQSGGGMGGRMMMPGGQRQPYQ